MQASQSKQPLTRRRRADTVLIFNPQQKVPGPVVNAIIGEWLVPALVEQFLRERAITHYSPFSLK